MRGCEKIVTKSHHVHEEGEWHEDCDAKSQLLPRVWRCLEAKNHLRGKSVKIFPELCLAKIAKNSQGFISNTGTDHAGYQHTRSYEVVEVVDSASPDVNLRMG